MCNPEDVQVLKIVVCKNHTHIKYSLKASFLLVKRLNG